MVKVDPKEFYEAPEFELLIFDVNSATSECAFISNSAAYTCPVQTDIGTVFAKLTDCEITSADGSGKICAMVSVESNKLFGS